MAARLEEKLPSNNLPKFTDREIRLINNCKNHVADDPAGLPGHNLIIIIAKLSDLLIGKELEEATGSHGKVKAWNCVNGTWFYNDPQAPWVMEFQGQWYYFIPTHDKTGIAMTKKDAMVCVEMVFNE